MSALLAPLAACSDLISRTAYRSDLRQGNYLDAGSIDALRPGMSRQHVQNLLGTPLISDPFHAERWDYVYLLRKNGELVDGPHRLTLLFKGDRLDRIEHKRETAANP